jgi:hypothetical protein
MYCPNCGLGQPDQHRFCISCGLPLPRDLLSPARGPKVTGLFPGIPTHWNDPAEPVLRVSRYLEDREVRGPQGPVVVPGHHVRFSIWVVDRPICAMSLPDDQTERLARFLLAPVLEGDALREPSLN